MSIRIVGDNAITGPASRTEAQVPPSSHLLGGRRFGVASEDPISSRGAVIRVSWASGSAPLDSSPVDSDGSIMVIRSDPEHLDLQISSR